MREQACIDHRLLADRETEKGNFSYEIVAFFQNHCAIHLGADGYIIFLRLFQKPDFIKNCSGSKGS